jgi:ankyrin repeat protein
MSGLRQEKTFRFSTISRLSGRLSGAGYTIYLLKGTEKLTVVRKCNGYFAIIQLGVPFPKDLGPYLLELSRASVVRDIPLIWNWEEISEGLPTFEYDDMMPTPNSDCNMKPLRRPQDYDQLTTASSKGLEVVVKMLLDADTIDLNSMALYSPLPLLQAIHYGYEAMVYLLLKSDKVNVESKVRGLAPLGLACRDGRTGIAKLLIDMGKADIESHDVRGWRPLHEAAAQGHVEVVKLLLTGVVDIESIDYARKSSLMFAAQNRRREAIGFFLETIKADVESKDFYGHTYLSRAPQMGHKEVVKVLIGLGNANVDAEDHEGLTPLAWAAQNGDEEVIIELLLRGKANVESEGDDGRTPLAEAAALGHEKAVVLLLGFGQAYVDPRDKLGFTPLALATREGQEQVVRVLIDQGKADPNAKTNDDSTPLDITRRAGGGPLVRLLESLPA